MFAHREGHSLSRVLIAAILFTQACGTSKQPSATLPPRPAHTSVSPEVEPPSAAGPPLESLRRLAASVDGLASRFEDPRQASMVRALRELADVLAVTPGGIHLTPIHVRDLAQRLEASPPSLTRADVVKEALTIALGSLVVRTPLRERARRFRDSVATIRRAIEAVDGSRPLADQQLAVAAAFRAIADAAFLAHGVEPPFGEADAARDGVTTGSPTQELEEARTNVLTLGHSRWPTVRWAAARALSSIADIIKASDPDGKQADSISKIRFQAERLRSADAPVFVEAKWVKIGLTTALDALDALQENARANDRASVTPWTRAARRAVGTIEADGALSFQRAAVQDGFRATVDAFAAAAQSSGVCR